MLRSRLHCRSSASSYLRKKVTPSITQSCQILLSDSFSSDSSSCDNLTDDDTSVDGYSDDDNNVEIQVHDMAIVSQIEKYMLIVAKLFDEINISDSTQAKLYELIRTVGRDKVYFPPYNDFSKFLKCTSSISVKKYVYCENCDEFTLQKQNCPCTVVFGDLRVFDLCQTIELAVKVNKEYLKSSINPVENLTGPYHGSRNYNQIWRDTVGKDVIRITLIYNIDDASFVKSARITSTPISFIIAELPEHRRYCKNNVFMASLWWGNNKANYDDLWSYSVTKELKNMNTTGIRVNIDNEYKLCMVRIGAIVTDSVAKPKIMNIMQYNGKYGCPYCQHPGESMQTARGGSKMCFPWNGQECAIKDHDFYINGSIVARNSNLPHMGIKGPCSLGQFILLPDCFPIDYMHCVLEGVFKTIFGMKPFNLSATTKKIDDIGKSVQLPHEFSRKFRKISDLTYWKASECRTFLLYLTPLLRSCIDSESFHLVIALSVSLRLLIKNTCCNHDISLADELLKIFLVSYQEIYGENSMRFNVHLLSHLINQVKKMGSLSNLSSFVFEDNIFKLKKTIHGNRGQNTQMVERYLRSKAFLNQTLNMDPAWSLNGFESSRSVHCMDKQLKNKEINANIMRMLRSRFGNLQQNQLSIYGRAKKGHIIYHSLNYSYRRSSASYYFHFHDMTTTEKRYGEIQYFILIPDCLTKCGHDKIFAVYREYLSYSKQSLFTNIEKLKSVALKNVPNLVKNAQIFHKIKRSDKINIIEMQKIEGKAIIIIESIRLSTYYATPVDSAYEHD